MFVSATIGSIVDYGIKDAANMGAVMAPSAAKTIANHLYNMKKTIDDYDFSEVIECAKSLGSLEPEELTTITTGWSAGAIVEHADAIKKLLIEW